MTPQEVRCVACNRLLLLIRLDEGATWVQARCPRCGALNALSLRVDTAPKHTPAVVL